MLAPLFLFIAALIAAISAAPLDLDERGHVPFPRTASDVHYKPGPYLGWSAYTKCWPDQALVDVTIYNIQELSDYAAAQGNSPVWVNSWNGDDYGDACIQLWQNTITVPEGGCGAKGPVLCAKMTDP